VQEQRAKNSENTSEEGQERASSPRGRAHPAVGPAVCAPVASIRGNGYPHGKGGNLVLTSHYREKSSSSSSNVKNKIFKFLVEDISKPPLDFGVGKVS